LELALKTIGIAIFSISMLISFGLTSNQAFAGTASPPLTCEEAETGLAGCAAGPAGLACRVTYNGFLDDLMCRSAVGGDMIQMETTSVLAAGAQYTAAWMIPVIVSAIGIGIVIARKF